MMEGEMLPTEADVDGTRQKQSLPESEVDNVQMKSGLSSGIDGNTSVTFGSKTNSDVETNNTDAGPQGPMDQIREELNIDIQDHERISFIKILRMAMRRRMEIFAEEASIVGLSYLVRPSTHKVGSIIRKIVWTMLLLFGTGFMVYQIYDKISYYLSYPTIVNYRVAYNRSLLFPTVTICSENFLGKKAFLSMGPEAKQLTEVLFPPIYSVEFSEMESVQNVSQLDIIDGDRIFNYIYFQMENMMLGCSFGNQPCNSDGDSGDITKIVTDMGLCYSFNPADVNYATSHPGATDGLRLVLWANQSDYYMTSSPAVGFRVVLNDPRDEPLVQTVGFRVGTGISTSVSFSLRNVTMLPSPYGDCREGEAYRRTLCVQQCEADFVWSECKCRAAQSKEYGGKACSLDQYYRCVSKALARWINSGASSNCYCPLHCYQPTYPYSISTSPFSDHFLNYMSRQSQFKGRNLTMFRLSKELVYLNIFYSQLSYVDIQTTPAYDLLTLVCDISGALGLILGGTLLTIVEFSEFFLQLINELFTSAQFTILQRR